jgi:hypothetical protein
VIINEKRRSHYVIHSIFLLLLLYFINGIVNLWGYARLAIGPGKGGYYHPRFFFRENAYEICKMQRRRIIKGGASTASSPKSSAFSTKETVSAATNTSSFQQQQVIVAAKKQKKFKRQPSLSAVSVVSQGSSDCELSPIKPPKTLTTTTMTMMMPTSLPDSSKSNCTAASTSIATAISPDNNRSLQSILDLDLDFDGLEFLPPSQVQQQQQQESAATTTINTYINPPQGGDCIDFEGRSYFFLDDKEIATAYNTACDVELLRSPSTAPVPRRVSRQNHEQKQLSAAAAAVPIGMVPALPNLTTANMLSEISRRRVSVEIDKFAAASRRVYDHAASASASTSTSASVSTTEQQDDDGDEWWQ